MFKLYQVLQRQSTATTDLDLDFFFGLNQAPSDSQVGQRALLQGTEVFNGVTVFDSEVA